jgi:hypothetical protein
MNTGDAHRWDRLASDIENTVSDACEWLEALSEEAVSHRKTPADWSAKEIIGHLIDSASNNHQRFVRLQVADVLDFPDYQQDNTAWVKIQRYHEASWKDLLDLWQGFNRHLARIVRNVDRRCMDHIWVKDADTTVTLAQLMIDYLQHLRAHIVQINESITAWA